MDGTGSRAGLRVAITDLARRFEGMSKAGDKEEKRLAKLLDHVDSPKAASGAEDPDNAEVDGEARQ